MTAKDMLAALPRQSLFTLLTAINAVPDFRCTTQLRVAATNAWRKGILTDAAIAQEYQAEMI